MNEDVKVTESTTVCMVMKVEIVMTNRRGHLQLRENVIKSFRFLNSLKYLDNTIQYQYNNILVLLNTCVKLCIRRKNGVQIIILDVSAKIYMLYKSDTLKIKYFQGIKSA